MMIFRFANFLYFFCFFTTPNIPTKPNKILLPQFHIKFVAKIVKFKNFFSCIRKKHICFLTKITQPIIQNITSIKYHIQLKKLIMIKSNIMKQKKSSKNHIYDGGVLSLPRWCTSLC